jgi:hypothetical protein
MKFGTMKKVFLFLTIGLACAISMTSCNEYGKDPGDVPLTEIAVDRESARVNVRHGSVDVNNVNIYPVPANATNVDFKWETQNPSVATVVEDKPGVGRITVHKAGSTVVTIRSGQIVSKEIKVEGYIEVMELTGIRWSVLLDDEPVTVSPLILPVGLTVNVLALPEPVNANTLTSDGVTLVWESDNEDVATVDQTGKITVTGTGEAKITVSCVEYEGISTEIVIEGV